MSDYTTYTMKDFFLSRLPLDEIISDTEKKDNQNGYLSFGKETTENIDTVH